MAATHKNESYIQGNTVRKNVRVLEDHRNDLQYQIQRQERKERRRSIAQAERMSLVYVLFLAAAAVMLVCICYQFLTLQTTMKKNIANISSLRVQVEEMKAQNDFNLTRIEESVDLNQIKQIAGDKLGMKEADASQIINYDYDASDYVRQYKSVPEGEKPSVLDYFSK